MKIVVIIQARMGSTRLPGKVMLHLQGKSVLAHVIQRCQKIGLVDEVIIATTDKEEDDLIVKESHRIGIFCYRGSELNVLQRYYEAALSSNADVIVRVTSDCPLIDPEVSNQVISKFLSEADTDYCSNTLKRSYPQGLDIEVFSFSVLEQAYQNAMHIYETEHVTPYIYQHPEKFKLTEHSNDLNYSHFRWTLDTSEDWELIQKIYLELYQSGSIFPWKDAIKLMENEAGYHRINAKIQQKKLTDL